MPIDEAIDPVARRAAVLMLKTVDFTAALMRIPDVPDAQTCDARDTGGTPPGYNPSRQLGR